MKAFENKTINQKEYAVKKGETLPPGAVNLRMVFIRWHITSPKPQRS